MNYNAYPWSRWLKWIIAGVIVLIIVASTASTYNGLVAADEAVKSSWSQVENVMQRRADLIPNLVETVKGYTKHEEKVFGDIAAARSTIMNGSSSVQDKLNADASITSSLKALSIIVESYPDLKANTQFIGLQDQIEGSENRISNERTRFIEKVNSYNTKVKRFPGSIFARLMGFSAKEYYTASPGATETPKVQF